MTLADTCLEYFAELEDPRIENHNFRHRLNDILIITILVTICGVDDEATLTRTHGLQ